MSNDALTLARARFFAKIDRMVNEVSVTDSCGGDDVLPVPLAGSLLRGHTPEEDEEGDGTPGQTVELHGDWSWRPNNQVKDPGYAFTAREIDTVNEALELGRAFGTPENKAMRWATGPGLIKARPWMVPAYDGRDLVAKPQRIGSIR